MGDGESPVWGLRMRACSIPYATASELIMTHQKHRMRWYDFTQKPELVLELSRKYAGAEAKYGLILNLRTSVPAVAKAQCAKGSGKERCEKKKSWTLKNVRQARRSANVLRHVQSNLTSFLRIPSLYNPCLPVPE